MNASILIIEDEKHLADGLRFNLEADGYRVDIVADGETGLELLTQDPKAYDVVVLDVMLPGIDGFEVAARLRSGGQFVPVLMLTARSRPEDVLKGFESGADDYLPKPFELAILAARIKGLLRRRAWLSHENSVREVDPETPSTPRPTTFKFNGKTIDFEKLELHANNRTVRLTLMEADFLRYLIERAGRVVSRRGVLEDVWDLREDTDTRAIDNFVVRLRKYIEDEPSKPRHLLTVRGVGYRFIAEPE